jgi:hypothetical protein
MWTWGWGQYARGIRDIYTLAPGIELRLLRISLFFHNILAHPSPPLIWLTFNYSWSPKGVGL